eukprot:1996678-Pyramimonas_sp.AAC.1
MFVCRQGFPEGDDMCVLMDEGHHTRPTLRNIQSGLDWLTDEAKAGDVLFFHFSGHGGQVRDTDGA